MKRILLAVAITLGIGTSGQACDQLFGGQSFSGFSGFGGNGSFGGGRGIQLIRALQQLERQQLQSVQNLNRQSRFQQLLLQRLLQINRGGGNGCFGF